VQCHFALRALPHLTECGVGDTKWSGARRLYHGYPASENAVERRPIDDFSAPGKTCPGHCPDKRLIHGHEEPSAHGEQNDQRLNRLRRARRGQIKLDHAWLDNASVAGYLSASHALCDSSDRQ
jgi:hypothetical protein